ncbi:D-mannonate dehydratase ManD [Marinitenerispora sediminis]|uniref:Bifunctional D-altronate/D-mannonate dehydratase n=1 Tax=Marinitenerispora sediminis TaxID=1931232 RepID=A0A368TBR3_9ACTN|nr:D-mannonate dehydratase ManD [Marinitenerispora sediminis]RCV53677.1 bifunctional D-altronate/D-mannonate dehydratase [Marinitenerispora sediminis]RCV57339.1 bifunctional D-altronate/D-mannonate dehydratase [Marinitenerispora sediminis]RCV62380.1 bifunctional D-altronate/D-mannonate dehydratase [Marinitenerispora sediminis]
MSDRIVGAEVIVTSPTRNFVTLKVTTDDGVVGYGDATLNGRELAVASYLRDHVAPLLLGRDARRVEDTWQYLYRGAYWRRGPVTMAAIGAVDVALWDIKGKTLGQPVYQLLGGPVRDRVLGYTHATGWELPELLDSVREKTEQGFQAVRAQMGVPGLDTVYGVDREARAYEPAGRGAAPVEEVWDTDAYLRSAPDVLSGLRAEVGPELRLLHDAHHRLTPQQAARLGRALEPADLFWLEDVTPAENQEALRLVRRHTTVPLAVGEVFNTVWDCQQLITEQLIDFVRTCVSHAGGISHVRRIFQLAELYQVRGAPHGPSDVSPVALGASLHVGLSTPNFAIQEYMGYDPLVHEVFPHAWSYADGHLTPGDAPGIGVGLDEALAARFPYEGAYLPVARRRDGSMTDW